MVWFNTYFQELKFHIISRKKRCELALLNVEINKTIHCARITMANDKGKKVSTYVHVFKPATSLHALF